MERQTYSKCRCPFCQIGRVKKIYRNGLWWGQCTNSECTDSLACCRLLSRRKQNGVFLWGSHHVSVLTHDVQAMLLMLGKQGKIPVYIQKHLSIEDESKPTRQERTVGKDMRLVPR